MAGGGGRCAPGAEARRHARTCRRRRSADPPHLAREDAGTRHALMLLLAFDTATDVATSALVDDGRVLGERMGVARTLLDDVQALLDEAGVSKSSLGAVVVGTGPGSFTSTRIGLAVARGLGLALDVPGVGVSTLAALASVEPGAYPVVDARRSEVFVPGPRAVSPDDL